MSSIIWQRTVALPSYPIVYLNGFETKTFFYRPCFAQKTAEMMMNISRSPLLLAAVFFALRGYLPMVASEIIGNGTYPNSMEGRGFWSTIPMPVISHFAGDKSRKNRTVEWRRVTIAERRRMSIPYALMDFTVYRRLDSLKSFDATCMKTTATETVCIYPETGVTTSCIRRVRDCCRKSCRRKL